jgi:TonB family protein
MSQRTIATGADRYLTWAFALALLVHACALSTGARLSTAPNGNGLLDSIRVFDASAPVMVTPVALVEWSEETPEVAATVAPAPTPPLAAPPGPALAKRVQQGQRPAALAGGKARAAKTAGGRAAGQGEPPGGGGGGGFVSLGSPSANGDLPGQPSGETPSAQVPAVGAGSGRGVGTGTGTGAGDGSGSGSGSGGTAVASGGEGSGFVSRVADRAEPEVVSKGKLSYPESAVEQGVEGRVELKVLVTEAGAVAEVEVVRSSGDRRLDEAAKAFVRGWRYRPATQDGRPRAVHSLATVTFELD